MANNKLRQNITKIRTSCHCLPIETQRKKKISREDRVCNLCKTEIGTEFHVLMNCRNSDISNLRETFLHKIWGINDQLRKLNVNDLFKYLVIGVDKEITFSFAIYLQKVFKLVKFQDKCE